MFREVFKAAKIAHWTILEKRAFDKFIFRTVKPRNRLMLEFMAPLPLTRYHGFAQTMP